MHFLFEPGTDVYMIMLTLYTGFHLFNYFLSLSPDSRAWVDRLLSWRDTKENWVSWRDRRRN